MLELDSELTAEMKRIYSFQKVSGDWVIEVKLGKVAKGTLESALLVVENQMMVGKISEAIVFGYGDIEPTEQYHENVGPNHGRIVVVTSAVAWPPSNPPSQRSRAEPRQLKHSRSVFLTGPPVLETALRELLLPALSVDDNAIAMTAMNEVRDDHEQIRITLSK